MVNNNNNKKVQLHIPILKHLQAISQMCITEYNKRLREKKRLDGYRDRKRWMDGQIDRQARRRGEERKGEGRKKGGRERKEKNFNASNSKDNQSLTAR